jgi:hypothetical protein
MMPPFSAGFASTMRYGAKAGWSAAGAATRGRRSTDVVSSERTLKYPFDVVAVQDGVLVDAERVQRHHDPRRLARQRGDAGDLADRAAATRETRIVHQDVLEVPSLGVVELLRGEGEVHPAGDAVEGLSEHAHRASPPSTGRS